MLLNKEILIGLYDSAFEVSLDRFWSFGVTSNSGATLSGLEVEYSSTSLLVDWGDAQRQFVSSGTQTNHTFVADSSGVALLAGGGFANNPTITLIDCGRTTPKLQGTVSLSAYTGLLEFTCKNNNITKFTGNNSLPNLIKLNLELNSLTDNIPSLSSNTALREFNCRYNSLTGFEGGTVSTVLDIFEADNNLLTSGTVNSILSSFVVANNTTTLTRILNLGGAGNQAPTGAGITDKAALTAIGWTVITN